MITQEKIQSHIDEAKRELNNAITMAVEYGKQMAQHETEPMSWMNTTENLQDGKYVGVLPDGGYVFVSAVAGKLYPVEYCKKLTKWVKLPD